jgi:hypothetical protein
MLVNFSHEEIVIPKATVIGVAEEISPSLIAALNEDEKSKPEGGNARRKPVNTVKNSDKHKAYVQEAVSHLSGEEKQVMEAVLLKYGHVFHDESKGTFPGTDVIEHRIITGDAKPIRKAPYRVPFALRGEMERQVKDMLDKGIIEPSSSPWSAPCILVPKKSSTGVPKWRFCLDFRALNKVVQYDNYPLPVFEETVSTLYGSAFFSVLDCQSGYWQVKIAEEDKMKTAFTVPSGSYQCVRLPYGLSTSPSSFQRMIDLVLRDLIGPECYVFIDDVIVFGKTIQEHASRLEHVLQRFEKAKLQLHPGKCVFAQPQVEYLGYIVSKDGIKASPDKTKAVQEYPAPKSVTEVRQFLGLASFYRRLVPGFAEIAKPLTELLRKNVTFRWSDRQQAAFDKLKQTLCSDQVLGYPDFTQPFILTTDASKIAVAAVLSQVQDGVERPLSYASRQMNTAEQNYSATESEMLAATWGIGFFRCYLFGRRFVLKTDHSALVYMHKFADNNSRLLKWSLKLSEYDFEVQHKPAAQIRHVDSLSRAVQTVSSQQALSREEVKVEQSKDKFCTTLKVGKEKGKTEYFADEEGLIYRRRKNGEHQLIVPASMIQEVIKLNHDPVFSAHPGRNRTLDLLCVRFYWPGMRRDVEEYVKNCVECQHTKPRHEFRAPMGDMIKPAGAFETVAMDLVGPLPQTSDKNRYLLTFIDHLTLYPEAIPVKSATAEECAKIYATHIVARHGAGTHLLSDRGSNFTSAFFKETCKILGVKQLFTTSYNPKGNSKLERFHRTLCEGLTHFVNACGNTWDVCTPFFLMAFRNTPHGTTGFTPFYMLHARQMNLPSMQHLKAKLSPEIRNTDHAERLENLQRNLRMAYKVAREHSDKAHATNKRYYDRSARERVFTQGEYVFLYSPVIKPGRSAKFRRCWSGPWKVLRRKSELTYAIVNKLGKEMTVHVNRLKKAYNVEGWSTDSKVTRQRRPKRQETKEEDEEPEVVSSCPIQRDPQVENRPQERTPVREQRQDLDTPSPGPSPPPPPTDHRADPTYVPDRTPRSQRDMVDTRESPPLTRSRRRLEMLPGVPEEEPDD